MITHNWTTNKRGTLLIHNGDGNAIVGTKNVNGKHLWVFHGKAGHVATIEKAKEIIEASAEFLPRKVHWN